MGSVGLLTDAYGNTVDTPPASGSTLDSVFNGITGILGSVLPTIVAPATNPGLSPTPTTSQPYPVTENGAIVGYSSVPTGAGGSPVPAANPGSISFGMILLLGIAAFAIYKLA